MTGLGFSPILLTAFYFLETLWEVYTNTSDYNWCSGLEKAISLKKGLDKGKLGLENKLMLIFWELVDKNGFYGFYPRY